MRAWAIRAFSVIRQPHIAPIAVSIVLGPLLGLGAYLISVQRGPAQFVLSATAGALIIGLVASLLQKRSSGLVLRDVTLTIPEFSSLTFVMNDEHKRVAWHLFVETASRVATQPLPPETGYLREALSSLHSLFATTRDVLKGMDPSRARDRASVEVFALGMLNIELRPFLAKWHPRLAQFERTAGGEPEWQWPESADCRTELEAMRRRLLAYCRAFGELAGVKDVDAYFVEETPDSAG